MKSTYQQKITLSFLVIFTVLTIGIVAFEQQRGKRYKTEALEERLDAYADIIYNFTSARSYDAANIQDSLLSLLPPNLRMTCIRQDGTVTYDNAFPDPAELENHASRPEILSAREDGKGYDIRTSASNNKPYLYYAKYYGNGFVRTALPYDIYVQHFLKPDNGFLYFILGIFIIGFLLIHYAGGHFGKSIRRLHDFSVAVSEGRADVEARFPKDELGAIGKQIVKDYKRLKESEMKLSQEREKLLQHVQGSAEGICFFNPDNSVAFYNGLFLQYFNIMNDGNLASKGQFLKQELFGAAYDFINSEPEENYFETTVNSNGREFLLRINRFEDMSYELVINDITQQEKTRQLKKEMTGNIAHELRTPVTSIRGFLETVLDTPLQPDQQRSFLEKAYSQTIALSELIRDMGLLTKIEEKPDNFDFRPVNLHELLSKVGNEMEEELRASETQMQNNLPAGLTVNGNESLLHAVFRNLTDNTIRYAGRGSTITIKEIRQKEGFTYISFADTGRGIEDETQLGRLFERFYRADGGRTRENGGSGLGLSIVKNAINIHGGTVNVKNRKDGGLEFVFYLRIN